MSESKKRKEFAKNLLAQDPPPTDEPLRRNEELFKKLKHRACLQKAVIIAIFIVIYFVAFWAFMLSGSTDNMIHSICWGTVSLHIALWSLVYILRGNCMNMEDLIEKNFDNDERRKYKNQNLFLAVLAIIMFIFNSIMLYRSFFLVDPLRAVQKTMGILWPAIFLLIYYSLRIASLIEIFWFEYKKMELSITKPKDEKSETQHD